MSFQVPENEAERVRALLDYQILDTEAESAFDDLTKLAAIVCDAPTAFISFIDTDRQWLKSRFGSEATETSRDVAFCAHTILNPTDILVIEDATKDERFAGNSFVTGEPFIRFYAGAPLVSPEGFALGSLCVIDYAPRTFSNEQAEALKLLAAQVVAHLEARRAANSNAKLYTRYRHLLENAPDGIHLYDFEGRITGVNRRFCELTGRSEVELLQLRIQDLVLQEDLNDLPIRFEKLRDGGILMSERRIVRPDKTVLSVEVSGRMIDENTIQGLMRDISERKANEAELTKRENLYRTLVGSLPQTAVVLFDKEMRFTLADGAEIMKNGFSREMFEGKTLHDVFPPEISAVWEDYYARALGGEELSFEQRDSKNERDLFIQISPVKNEAGEIFAGMVVWQNITERKRTETALRESERRFRDFLNSSLAFFCTHELDGTVLSVSPAAADALGYPEAELVGENLSKILLPEVHKILPEYLSQLETDGESRGFMWIQTKSGARRVWSYSNAVRTGADGKRYVLGSAQDVTELKNKEEELKTTRDAALESARMKSAFLTNVSHEIRTPMNGVIGMTELLLDTSLDRTQREYAETIRQSGDALLTVINDILDLAKIEAGKLRFEAVDFDLRETVESTVESLAERAFRKNLEIASLIGADVPLILCGDAGRLRQVLTNLIGNAIKYTEKGEIGITVEAEKSDKNSVSLRFTVTDTGIGIDSQNLKHLFQPFVQVDSSTTRQFGGTGLGLAISKEIVEMMNGEISVESTVGEGSVFSFTATFAKSLTKPTGAGNTDLPAFLREKKILLADVKKVTRRALRDYAAIWGLNTSESSSGDEALQMLAKAAADGKPFDAVVVDMNLPDWEGFALAERIKSDASLNRTQVILTTAYGQRGDAAQAHALGVSAYLTKPFRGVQLLECLVAVLKENAADDNSIHDSSAAPLVTRHSLREAKANTESLPGFDERQNLRLLVVEDNETNRLVLRHQLKQNGFSPDFAVDGEDALEKTAAKDYQIILMDCQMPKLDGYQTTAEIRRREREKYALGESFSHVAVIALTAHTLAGEREKCLAAGMDDYLSKPVKIKELITVLEFWSKSEGSFSAGNGELFGKSLPSDFAAEPEPFETADEDFGEEIEQLFLNETERHISELTQALSDDDYSRVARLAHAARGNALAVGKIFLAEMLEAIEKAAISNDKTRVFHLFDSFIEEFSRTRQLSRSVT